jgi:hypothetical protein
MVRVEVGTLAYANRTDPVTGDRICSNAWHLKPALEAWLESLGGVPIDGKEGLWNHVHNSIYVFEAPDERVRHGSDLQMYIETINDHPPPFSVLDHLRSTTIHFRGSREAGGYTLWFADALTEKEWANYIQRHKAAMHAGV